MWPGGRAATVYGALRHASRHYGSRPFLCVLPEVAQVYGIEAGELTYERALGATDGIARSFAAAGYGPGHRVGLLLENRPVYFLTWFALNSLGVAVVPINPDLRAAELEYLIGHSQMIAAVALPQRHAQLQAAAAAAGRTVAVLAPADTPPPVAAAAGTDPQREEERECALLYTSGTTGLPKGCVLSNDYFLICGEWYAGLGGYCAMQPGSERLLTPLPTFHMNAMATSAMTMLILGGCLIPLDRFHPRSWWDSVRSSRASIVHYLGVMPAILMGAVPSPQDRRHQVRFGFGAGVPRELHRVFEERFGFPLIEAWAMTETGAGAVIAAAHEPRLPGTSCIGRPPAALQVRLVREDGAHSGVDEPGELLVRAAGADPRRGFFSRYLNDQQATDEAWREGWFHTGDLVSRDTQGLLHFVDRRKNVIRRSGENIAAVEVEMVLAKHPRVRAVAVAAAPDPLRGDEVFACVVPHSPAVDADAQRDSAHELVRWCLERLAYFKAPGMVAFVTELPLTATQKIQRGAVKQLVAQLLADGAWIDTRAMKKR
ncbi:MAG: AMP-binding protein [Proteobacteria bacterium]|nr:AMP-binding protein [Pseudomonadota bacterium]